MVDGRAPAQRYILIQVLAEQMLFRARLVSFFAGLGVAGGFALFQLRQDVWESHKLLSEQVCSFQLLLMSLIHMKLLASEMIEDCPKVAMALMMYSG